MTILQEDLRTIILVVQKDTINHNTTKTGNRSLIFLVPVPGWFYANSVTQRKS